MQLTDTKPPISSGLTLATDVPSTANWGETSKKDAILEHLRDQIVRGQLAPGTQLPTRRELVKRYAVSVETVQRALDRLTQDQFVESNGRRGTYVCEHPPHLSRYALVFRHDPHREQEVWTRFWTALSQEAVRLRQSRERDITIFTGVNGHIDSPDFNALMREVSSERLAGIIFTDGVYGLEKSGLLESDIPKVSFGAISASNCTAIQVDHRSFGRRAVEHLAALGRKDVAVISHCPLHNSWNPVYEEIVAAAREHGLRVETHWSQVCSVLLKDSARGIANLLMHSRDTPDSLIVTDDNLIESSILGLIDAGVRAGEDVAVVAHTNFPYPVQVPGQITRLGFDVTDILAQSLASIDARRRHEAAPQEILSVARFSHELGPTFVAPAYITW